jgi:hypothetical protein
MMMPGRSDMVCVRGLLIQILIIASCYGQEPVKEKRPACNKQNHGMLWSEKTTNRAATQVCALDVWRYHWQSITVDYSELLKRSKSKEPEKDLEATGPSMATPHECNSRLPRNEESRP